MKLFGALAMVVACVVVGVGCGPDAPEPQAAAGAAAGSSGAGGSAAVECDPGMCVAGCSFTCSSEHKTGEGVCEGEPAACECTCQ